MKASVMDLRYKTKEVLRALEANEEILVTHRGTTKAKIVPISGPTSGKSMIANHPAVGMWKDVNESVPGMITRIRSPRKC